MIDLAAAGTTPDSAAQAALAAHVATCSRCAVLLTADRAARRQLADAAWPALPASLDRRLDGIATMDTVRRPAPTVRFARAALVAVPVLLVVAAFAVGVRWSVTPPAEPTLLPVVPTATPAGTNTPFPTATDDSQAEIVPAATSQVLLTAIQDFAFAPNGRDVAFITNKSVPDPRHTIYLAETAEDGTIEQVRRLAEPPPDMRYVDALEAAPKGRGFVASVSSDVANTAGRKSEERWLNADGSWGGPVIPPQASDDMSDAGVVAWAPDGTALAALDGDGQLWYVPLPAGTPRIIAKDLIAAYGGPGGYFTWSPDGRRIAIMRPEVPVGTLDVVDVATGDATVVRSFTGMPQVFWSPDSDALFYVEAPTDDGSGTALGSANSLQRIEAHAGAEPEFVANLGSGAIRASDVTPDGQRVVVLMAEDSGMSKLQLVRMSDGATMTDYRSGPVAYNQWAISANDRIAVLFSDGNDRAQDTLTIWRLAPMTKPVGRPLAAGLARVTAVSYSPTSEPTYTPEPIFGTPVPTPLVWTDGTPSPDGRWRIRLGGGDVVTDPNAGHAAESDLGFLGFDSVVAASADGTITRTVAAHWYRWMPPGRPNPHILGWTPASDAVVVGSGYGAEGCPHSWVVEEIRRFDVQTGVATDIAFRLRSPELAPDARTIAYIDHEAEGEVGVGLLDVASGTRQLLSIPVTGMAEDGGVSGFEWSPDSRRVAFVVIQENCDSQYAVGVVDVESSTGQMVLPFGPTGIDRTLLWEGDTLVVQQGSYGTPLPTGVPETLRFDMSDGLPGQR
jgi:Tol biopolymer transport system component